MSSDEHLISVDDRIYAKYIEEPVRILHRSRSESEKVFLEISKPKFKDFVTGPEPVRILHLSDLHIERNSDIISILQPLIDDIRNGEPDGIGIKRIDYLVISGDLIDSAGTVTFQNALDFIRMLLDEFNLDADKCIIVPGNHDLHWDKAGIYVEEYRKNIDIATLKKGSYSYDGEIIRIKNEASYNTRFDEFSKDLYSQLFGIPYPSESKLQFYDVLFHDTRIQFLALNSCHEIDRYNPKRASILDEALSEGLMKANREKNKEIETSKSRPIFRIAVWHHPVRGFDAMSDIDFLERLRANDFKICLHGHSHRNENDLFFHNHNNKVHVIGAGTSGLNMKNLPRCSPYEYNLLEIERDFSKVKVHTRCKRSEKGAWEGWALWRPKGASRFERRTYYEIEFDGLAYEE